MSAITTHVLDTALGRPAAGVPVRLERRRDDRSWNELAARVTDADGRVRDLLAPGELKAGTYRLRFEVEAYFHSSKRDSFYPEVTVEFRVAHPDQHHHVPLLLSPYGYSTYRGS